MILNILVAINNCPTHLVAIYYKINNCPTNLVAIYYTHYSCDNTLFYHNYIILCAEIYLYQIFVWQ